MKLLIMTDLEGVSGIVEWDEHEKGSHEMKEYVQFLMTNEVNGAIEGALKGGAEEVWVVESHTIDIRQIHPEAYLLKMAPGVGASPDVLGLKSGKWDAMAFIGNHSMANTPNGVLCHTQNDNVKSIHINDILVGEFGIHGRNQNIFQGKLHRQTLLADILSACVFFDCRRGRDVIWRKHWPIWRHMG